MKKIKDGDLVIIPPEEWGDGCQIDWKNNRLIGASVRVYENVQINRADLMKTFPPATTH